MRGHLYVDAVGVRAVSVGHDLHSLQLHILASIEHYVEHLTIQRGQSSNSNVIRVGETQRLNTTQNQTTITLNKFIRITIILQTKSQQHTNIVMLVYLASIVELVYKKHHQIIKRIIKFKVNDWIRG